MQRNREEYAMHAVTLSGFDGSDLPRFAGDSETPFLAYSARAIAEYIESLEDGPVVLLGHSVGAIVALKATISHPELVSALILEDWGAVHPASMNLSASDRERSASAAAEAMAAMSEDDYYSRFSAMMSQVVSDSGRAQIYIGMLRSGYGAAGHGAYEMHVLDLRPHLRELQLPMLGLFAIYPGTNAGARRQQVGELLAGAVNLELMWFENTSHWVHEEKPLAFDAAVRSFLSKL
jgi:pimeloyl-ACP methyl ester carboxylesterase